MPTDYGIQKDGSFRRKHVDEIESDGERNLKNGLGEDVELRQGSELKQVLDTMSIELALQWQALEEVYFSTFFEDASGEALSKQLALAGFSRLTQRSATGEVTFSRGSAAPDDINIPSGTVVTTSSTESSPAIPFETTSESVLDEGDTSVTVEIEALKPWQTDVEEKWLGEETNVAANSITEFSTPLAGVDSVTNPNPTGDPDQEYQVGRDRETDAEFRLRYQNSISAAGSATVSAIEAAVFQADERIESVDVEEVRDNTTNEYGVRVTVLAPDVSNDDIAQAIFDSRAGGLDSFGSVSGTADDDGVPKTENFDRAVEETIYIEANLTTSETFPSDGTETITDRLIRYLGGQASDGVNYPGLGVGEDVIFDQVKRRVMEEQGVVEADVNIGVDSGSLAKSNITIADDKAAMTGTAEVTVSVV